MVGFKERIDKLRDDIKQDIASDKSNTGLWASLIGILIGLVSIYLTFWTQNDLIDWAYLLLLIIILVTAFVQIQNRWKCEAKLGAKIAAFNERISELETALTEEQGTLDRIYQQARNIHNIFHFIRDGYLDITQNEYKTELVCEKTRTNIQDILNNLTRIIEGTTGLKCAACIKLFAPEQDSDPEPLLTFQRDSSSKNERNDDDGNKKYRVERNYAFHRIMETDDKYFYCGDIESLGDVYQNESKNWKSYYNCTAVVPIQGPLFTQEGKTITDIAGFLCIDTLETDGFPEIPTVHFLACVSDSLYLILKHYRGVVANETNQTC